MVHNFYFKLIGENYDYSEQYQIRFSEFIKKFKTKVKENLEQILNIF